MKVDEPKEDLIGELQKIEEWENDQKDLGATTGIGGLFTLAIDILCRGIDDWKKWRFTRKECYDL